MIFLQTNRLKLRSFKREDLDNIYTYRNDFNCAQYQSWECNEVSLPFLKSFIEKESKKDFSSFPLHLGISLKDTDELIGEMFIAIRHSTITLGYTIAPAMQRKGYAYEILSNIIPYLSSLYKNYEFVCLVHPNNLPSINLMHKMNFLEEGYEPKLDSIIFSYNHINK